MKKLRLSLPDPRSMPEVAMWQVRPDAAELMDLQAADDVV